MHLTSEDRNIRRIHALLTECGDLSPAEAMLPSYLQALAK